MSTKSAAVLNAKLLDIFRVGATRAEAARRSGLSLHTVIRYVDEMRQLNPPMLYVEDWMEDPYGRRSEQFLRLTIDKRTDAVRPKQTKEQRLAAARKRTADKRAQRSSSVFNQVLPRYAPGSRLRSKPCPSRQTK